jgi:hypothetical protein
MVLKSIKFAFIALSSICVFLISHFFLELIVNFLSLGWHLYLFYVAITEYLRLGNL